MVSRKLGTSGENENMLVATRAEVAMSRSRGHTFDSQCKCIPFVRGECQHGPSRILGVSHAPCATAEVGDLNTIPGRATVAALAPVLSGSLPRPERTIIDHFISSLNSPLIISRESVGESADI